MSFWKSYLAKLKRVFLPLLPIYLFLALFPLLLYWLLQFEYGLIEMHPDCWALRSIQNTLLVGLGLFMLSLLFGKLDPKRHRGILGHALYLLRYPWRLFTE